MQAANVGVERLTLERRVPLVRCTIAAAKNHKMVVESFTSCGAMIPHRPSSPCPECGERQYKQTAPSPQDGDRVIDGNAVIVDADTEQVVAVHVTGYDVLASRIAALAGRVSYWNGAVATSSGGRLSGIQSASRTFGYTPPQPMRRRYACSKCRLDDEYPALREQIAEMCRAAEWVFRTHAPDVHATTGQRVRETIPPAWLIAGTPWTSGIVNRTAALPYHTDSGNVPSSWSAMLCARRDITGGMLHLADYDVWLAVPHGSMSIFDGQSVLHGVTPFRATSPKAHRYTLVTYAKAGMAKCCPDPRDEVLRAARAATEAETLRHERRQNR